jgi:hypothetical protein
MMKKSQTGLNCLSILFSILIVFIFCTNSLNSVYAQELEGIIYVSDQKANFDPDKMLQEYVIGQTVYCALLAKGFSADASGTVNLTADVKLFDPDGKLLFSQENFTTVNRVVDKTDKGVVFDNSFDLEFNKDDQVGMYSIEVLVKDNLSGLSDKTITRLLLFDTNESKQLIMEPLKSPEQLDKIWAEYFKSKNPWAVKRIISALTLSQEMANEENSAIVAAAESSLVANGKAHPEILSICQSSLFQTKGQTRELLQKIIDQIKPGKENNAALAKP